MRKQILLCVAAFLCLCFAPRSEFDRNLRAVRPAIEYVESRGNANARNASEDAVGILQIRRIVVDDVNRILAGQKSAKRYTYEDRWDTDKSREIFHIYSKHYCDVRGIYTEEFIARNWNGGPNGYKKSATAAYWHKVCEIMEKNNG